MSVLTVIGARPQFVKAAAVSRELDGRLDETVVHTGQHYDEQLSAVFFDELDLDEPDHTLDVGSGTHASQTASIMVGVEQLITRIQPSVVLVYGDTNSTLAGALAAAKGSTTLAHVEAGLRSGNMSMPEEVNRICTDHCSDVCYAPSRDAVANLEREGITAGVVEAGDVMYDTLLGVRDRFQTGAVDAVDVPDEFVLATVHRAGNTDDQERLSAILDGLSRLSRPVLFPSHPRTVEALDRYGLTERAATELELLDPVGYLTFLRLLSAADVVATDSGGVQKEAFYLDTPCVTLRRATEWVETVDAGWNVLVGTEPDRIVSAVRNATDPPVKPDLYGGGSAASRIVDDLERRVG